MKDVALAGKASSITRSLCAAMIRSDGGRVSFHDAEEWLLPRQRPNPALPVAGALFHSRKNSTQDVGGRQAAVALAGGGGGGLQATVATATAHPLADRGHGRAPAAAAPPRRRPGAPDAFPLRAVAVERQATHKSPHGDVDNLSSRKSSVEKP